MNAYWLDLIPWSSRACYIIVVQMIEGSLFCFPPPDFQLRGLSNLRTTGLTIKDRSKEGIENLSLFLVLSGNTPHCKAGDSLWHTCCSSFNFNDPS